MSFPRTLEKIIGTVGAVLIGGALLFAPARKAEAKPYLMIDAQFDFNYGTPTAQIQTVPEYMRNVPAHPGDSDEHIGPIEDSQYSFVSLLNIEGRAGVGFRELDKFDFSIGAKAGIEFAGGGGKERNYTNAPGTDKRGYGAALTYYGTSMGRLSLGAFARASFFASSINLLSLEYSADISALQAIAVENGWDRYNTTEVNEIYRADFCTLNHTIEVISGDLNLDSFNTKVKLFLGVKIPQLISQSALATEMGFTVSPSFFGGIKLEGVLDTLP